MGNSSSPKHLDKDKEASGVVFDIQRYSIHDGPGIRTTVFLKGCPLTCYWCQNPESQSMEPEILFAKNNCTGCGRCVTACAAGANTVSGSCAEVDRQRCKGSGRCAEVCPNDARRIAGKIMTVSEVMREVLKDTKIYEVSKGGVTLSGGEATFQPDFALALLRECKSAGLHTTLETCGYTSWEVLQRLLQYIDFVLLDIKHMDAASHKRGTGQTNDIILANAKRIASCKQMKVRVPLIPGFNDSQQAIREIALFVDSLPNPVEIDLLAYNNLGEGKYARLDKKGLNAQVQSSEQVEALRGVVNAELRGFRSNTSV